METRVAKTRRIMLFHDARDVIKAFRAAKDEFAKAYKIKNFRGMRRCDGEIRSQIRVYATLFVCQQKRHKKRTSMDLKEPRDFREDQRIVNYVARLRALASHMDQDVSTINLFEFCRHADQAEKVMYQILDRMRQVKNQGVDDCRMSRRRPKQSPRMRENFEDWESWINSEKQSKKEDILEIFSDIDELADQFANPTDQNEKEEGDITDEQ